MALPDGSSIPPRAASEALWERGRRLIPDATQTLSKGANQFVLGVHPIYLARGDGSHVWDVDGTEYIDYSQSLGPNILGHNFQPVSDAVIAQLSQGINFTLPHPLEVEVAELITSVVPAAEMVRYAKNGSDATSAAVRLARAVTGREHVAFCGYHGWEDWYVAVTSRNVGVPRALSELMHSFQYNNLASLEALFAAYPEQIAAVIMEPIVFEAPAPGFLAGVRDLAHKHGALLIFDEVITGFRFALGGAQERYGVIPDLCCLGKAIANGLPLSVLAGRRDYMEEFSRLGVFISMTFGGETLSLAAAKATIGCLQTLPVYEHIWRLGDRLQSGFNALAAQHGLPVNLAGLAPKMLLQCNDEHGQRLREPYYYLLQELIKRGVLTNSTFMVSWCHSDADIDHTLAAAAEALDLLATAWREGTLADKIQGDIPSGVSIVQEARR